MTKAQKQEIITLFELGLSISEVASISNNSDTDILQLIKSDSAVSIAHSLGVKAGNIKVIKALLKSAVGYEDVEVETYTRKSKEGNVIFKDNKRTKKNIQPNLSAIKFWLENKSGDEWKKSISDVEKNMNIKISIEGKDIVVKNE